MIVLILSIHFFLIFRVSANFEKSQKWKYEADHIDIQFLQGKFMQLHSSIKLQPFCLVISSFEQIIIRFEKIEMEYFISKNIDPNKRNYTVNKTLFRQMFSLYQLWDIKHKIFNRSAQSSIYKYWRDKQKTLRRPLLRCYWYIIHNYLSNFGPQDPKKLAFAPRPTNKKKIRTNSRCLKGERMLDRLSDLMSQMEKLRKLVKMTTLREKLKLQNELINRKRSDFKNFIVESDRVMDQVMCVMNDLPEKMNASFDVLEKRKKKIDEDEDMMIFLMNLIGEIGYVGFDVADFLNKNAVKTSKKIRRIRSYDIISQFNDNKKKLDFKGKNL